MLKSLLKIFRIDSVTSRFRMFLFFENRKQGKEFLVFILEEKHERYGDDDDHYRDEDKYGSHYFIQQ